MPEQRPIFRPEIRLAPPRDVSSGFTSTNTSGLDGVQIAALNVALARLIDAGLTEHQGKLALDAAVRIWLAPEDAADAELERLLAWR